MSAGHVGGRMETKAPIRVTDRTDHYRMAALFAISLALHAWMISNSAMTARDSLGFARLGVNLVHPSDGKPPAVEGDGIDRTLPQVLKHAQQPPGYPLSIYATYAIVKRIQPTPGGGILHDRILRSAQIACAAAMVLAVFPMYWLGRMLLDKDRSFAAVLIFTFLPVVARDTSDGLSEGLFFFGFSSALALGVAGLRKQSVGRFLICGFAIGLTYLVRPEALAVAVAALAILAGLAILKLRPRANMLACAAALLVGTGIAAAPYMMLIGGVTNKPSGKQATEEFNPRMRVTGEIKGNVGPLFAEWRRDGDDATAATKAADAAQAILNEYLQASHWAVGILGVVGLGLTVRRFREQPEWLLPLGAAAVHLVVLARVAYTQGYASERHLLTSAFAATYFAMAGLPTLFEWFSKWPVIGGFYRRPEALWLWVTVLVGICIPSLLKPMHANRVGFREGGLILAERFERDRREAFEERLKTDPQADPAVDYAHPQLTDPSEWVQFYSGRTYHMPPALTEYRKPGIEYGVHLPNRDRNDSRLNALAYTIEMANDPTAELVFSWPEGPEEKVKLNIYRRVNPPRAPIPQP